MKKNDMINNIKSYFNRDKLLIIVICIAFILRLGLFIAFQPWVENVVKEEIFYKDAGGYHNLAVSILERKNFSGFQSFRTPGYPVFIAIIYMIFGNVPWVVLLFQILLNIISLLLVYKIGKEMFNDKIAHFGSILFAIDPHQIIYTVHLLADTLFVTTLLASIYTIILGLKNKKGKYILISGLLIGISTLIKPISQYLPFVILLFILLYKNKSLLFKIKKSIVYIIIFFITLSPWMLRNYVNYDYFSLSSIKSYNLLFNNVAFTKAWRTEKSIEQVRNEFLQEAKKKGLNANIYGLENSEIYTKIAMDYIKNNIFDYSIRHLIGIVNMYKSTGTKNIAHKLGMEGSVLGIRSFFKSKTFGEIIIGITIGVFLMLCYLIAFYGTFSLINEKKYYELTFLLLIIIYFSILTGTGGSYRYKLPITPFYILITSFGISKFKLIQRLRIDL